MAHLAQHPGHFRLIILLLLMFALVGCGGVRKRPQSHTNIDAVELKLKFRELADQLLTTMPNYAIQGAVAMPTSFVNQNNTQSSSQLGRLIAESMFYEFNQRGFPTREYRLTGNIHVTGARNNLVLTPEKSICAKQSWAALLLGTYLVDEDATFINARLVRARDGLVMRTAQLVLPNTPIIARLASTDRGYAFMGFGQNFDMADLSGGVIPIRQWR